MSYNDAFEILARDTNARLGRLRLAHGTVQTPAFMPVGTAATVKGIQPEAVAAAGADMILTYWALDVARWYRAQQS